METNAGITHICFGTICTLTAGQDAEHHEYKYQHVYKPLISSLYTLPDLAFTLYLSGPLLEWMAHNHPEFFMILEEMIGRKQIDIIGGGYYNPLFPMIPPADRVGQVELLTTEIRKAFGKRPRGVWLPASAWEPSMISSLCTCGIEYVLLDRIMLSTSGGPGVDGLSPVILEDSGKTVIALPLDNHYRTLERFTPETFLKDIKRPKRLQDSVLTIFIDHLSIPALFTAPETEQSWFSRLLALASSKGGVEFTTTGKCSRGKTPLLRSYVSSGMSPYDHDDLTDPDDVRILSRTSIKQYLLASENSFRLYTKMMFVHILVSQLRGDKARKKNAREDVWRAQRNEIFRLSTLQSGSDARVLRSLAYKHLLIAEKMTRVRGVFSPSVTASDFDMDTLKEYLCQLDKINVYIHPIGGKVFELDVFSAYRNYCDLSLPSSSGLFIDHFINSEELDIFIDKGVLPDAPVFSSQVYQDLSIDKSRIEVQLRANGLFGSFQQPLQLKKQYTVRNEGIQVQYILKNESPLALSGFFMTELDLSFSRNRHKQTLMTVYAQETRQDGPVVKSAYKDIEWMQISDNGSGVKFTFEANETPSVAILPVLCPDDSNQGDDASVTSEGARLFFYWKIELAANYEMEKTIFFKIDS